MGVNSITFLNFKNHNLETILKDIQIDIIKLILKKLKTGFPCSIYNRDSKKKMYRP